jgi:hypothetical protein
MTQISELRQMVRNMETMGWSVRRTSTNDAFVVTNPVTKVTKTINIRSSGHGRGLFNVMTAIRSLGYDRAWSDFEANAEALRTLRTKVKNTVPQQLAAPPAEQIEEKEQNVTVTPVSRETVNGVRVIARQPAMLAGPNSNGVKAAIRGVDEVLLENNRTLFQCTRSEFCDYVADRPESVRAHLPVHGTTRRAAKGDKMFRQRSAAGVASGATRARRVTLLLGDESRAAYLEQLADVLAEAVPTLRLLSSLKTEAPAPPEPLVSAEELAMLRRKAGKWDQWVALRED